MEEQKQVEQQVVPQQQVRSRMKTLKVRVRTTKRRIKVDYKEPKEPFTDAEKKVVKEALQELVNKL